MTYNYTCSISLLIEINWFFTHMRVATTAVLSIKNLFDLRYYTFYVKMNKTCSKQNIKWLCIICEPLTNVILNQENRLRYFIQMKNC